MRRYNQTRFSSPGKRGTVKPYDTETSPNGTVYYLSAYHTRYGEYSFGHMKPRVFWLHPTKGWRSQGARS